MYFELGVWACTEGVMFNCAVVVDFLLPWPIKSSRAALAALYHNGHFLYAAHTVTLLETLLSRERIVTALSPVMCIDPSQCVTWESPIWNKDYPKVRKKMYVIWKSFNWNPPKKWIGKCINLPAHIQMFQKAYFSCLILSH